MRLATAGRLAGRALRRSAAEQLFMRTGVDRTLPSDIRATLTERCNYRCVYCRHWRQDQYTPEMTLAEWQAALASIRDYVGRFAVQFLGGEPTVLPWFFDLADFCRDQGIDWGVVTNGSSLSIRRARRLSKAGPLNVDVSLDSRSEAVNDFARGVSGAMRQASAGIAALVEARDAADGSFPIRVKSVVTRHNLDQREELVSWVASMPGVLIDFSPVRLWQAAEIEALYPSRLDEMELLQQVMERLKTAKRAGAPIETSAAKLDATVQHFRGERNGHGVGACRVALRSIDIRPNGDVNHCWVFEKVGNLRRQSMADIWTGAQRRALAGEALSCELFKTSCSTSCHAHRRLSQEVRRGLQMLRSTRA